MVTPFWSRKNRTGSADVIDRERVAQGPSAPVTRTVKLEVPALDGVPLIVPVELNPRPVGSEPEAKDHAYGVRPPLA